MATIGFYGATGTVTGSRYLLESGGARGLIDCGFFQGKKEIREKSWDHFDFDPGSIDYVILTHGHLDHCGLLPRLVRQGFEGPVYATSSTAAILSIMYYDSVHLMEFEHEWRKRKLNRQGRDVLPLLYEAPDVAKTLRLVRPMGMDEAFSPAPGLTAVFRKAGHIFGAAHVEIEEKQGARIVFSGDIGQPNRPLLPDPHRFEGADVIVMESTYGDRLHKGLAESVAELEKAILDTAARRGKVVIPSFALGRTQEILFYINAMVESGRLKGVPVFVDSPMATALTEIIHGHPERYGEEGQRLFAAGDDPLQFLGLTFTRTTDDSKRLNDLKGPAIIISASGMCSGGRVLHHLKHNLWRSDSSIVFVGFQAEGTLGRSVVEGARMVAVFGEEIAVKARIYSIGGFSAHADRDELLSWVSNFQSGARRVFITHGEPKVARKFGDLVKERLGLSVTVPAEKQRVQV